MSKVKDERLLDRAVDFDRTVKEYMDPRTRRRPDISKMHDIAKRTMDETAKKLDK